MYKIPSISLKDSHSVKNSQPLTASYAGCILPSSTSKLMRMQETSSRPISIHNSVTGDRLCLYSGRDASIIISVLFYHWNVIAMSYEWWRGGDLHQTQDEKQVPQLLRLTLTLTPITPTHPWIKTPTMTQNNYPLMQNNNAIQLYFPFVSLTLIHFILIFLLSMLKFSISPYSN